MPDNDQTPAPAPAVQPDATDLTKPTQDDLEWGQATSDYQKEHGAEPKPPVKKEGEEDADKNKPAGTESDGVAKPGEEKPAAGDSDDKNDKGKELTPEEKKAAEDKKAEEDAAAKKKAEEEEAEKAKDETPEQTEARHKKEAADKKAAEEAEGEAAPAPRNVRDARATQAQLAEDSKAMEADIRKEMFSDQITELQDADGDPIRTIEDVQKLMNPNTKKPFTEEEAGAWLLAAQQNLNKTIEANDKTVREVAEVNLALKDQSDNVREKWGDLLKAMPQLAQKLYAEFQKTLVKDEKSDIIIKAPVNLESFYDTALAGYAKSAEILAQQEEDAGKNKKEQDRKNEKGDREDIVPRGKSNTQDSEDEGWAKAAKTYYES